MPTGFQKFADKALKEEPISINPATKETKTPEQKEVKKFATVTRAQGSANSGFSEIPIKKAHQKMRHSNSDIKLRKNYWKTAEKPRKKLIFSEFLFVCNTAFCNG